MTETSGLEAAQNDVGEAEKKVAEAETKVAEAKKEMAEAEKKVAEAEKKVAQAEKKVSEALKAYDACQRDDERRRDMLFSQHEKCISQHEKCISQHEVCISQHKVFVEQLRGAVSHLNALQSKLDRSTNRRHFDMMVAESPTAKHMHSAIASMDASAVTVWSFRYPKPDLSQKDRKRGLRKKAACHYRVYKIQGNKVQCQLSREWGDSTQVTANHLLPHSIKRHVMENLFHFSDINDMRNLLLLSKGVETAFEKGQIYFQGIDDRTFIMKILDESVKQNPIFVGSSTKIESLEEKALMIPKDVEPPFKRVLSHHAQDAYKNALQSGVITQSTEPPEEYGSPLKDNMLSITQATTDSLMGDDELED